MNDLLRGRVSRFSLDAPVNIAAAIGRRVQMEPESGSNPGRRSLRRPGAFSREIIESSQAVTRGSAPTSPW
jgi:hypothetical protein